MANPTTNFGWVMPTSSSLVTNLPADFNTFGQGVDTSMAQLKGGTTGQILSKTSATDMAFTWITNDVGDITAVTAGTGISGGGTSGAVTITNSMATEITAKGDLIAGTGSATFDNLPVGTNGQTLVADSTASTGLKWATASAASGPAFRAYPTTDQSIPATTFTKVLFGSETFDTASNFASSTFTPTTAGYYQLNVNLYMAALTAANDSMQIWKNGSNYQTFHNAYATGEPSFAMSALMNFNGTTDYAEIYFYKGGSGAGTVVSGTTASSFSGVWIRS